jgi:hypothetical protein
MNPRRVPDISAELLATCPPCFTPVFWREWLQAALAKNTPSSAAARARADAGLPPCPCEDCSAGYERRMVEAGRCRRVYLETIRPPTKSKENASA